MLLVAASDRRLIRRRSLLPKLGEPMMDELNGALRHGTLIASGWSSGRDAAMNIRLSSSSSGRASLMLRGAFASLAGETNKG